MTGAFHPGRHHFVDVFLAIGDVLADEDIRISLRLTRSATVDLSLPVWSSL